MNNFLGNQYIFMELYLSKKTPKTTHSLLILHAFFPTCQTVDCFDPKSQQFLPTYLDLHEIHKIILSVIEVC